MAQQGRAGAAMGMAAIASFIGGVSSTVIVAFFSPPLAGVALQFGAVEYFPLMILGLTTVVILAHGSVLKAVAMVVVGLLIGMIGTDVNSGDLRFTFGLDDLADGISFVVVAIGTFGIAQIIANLESKTTRQVATSDVKGLLPTREDFKMAWKSIVRGTMLGSALGILPGTGATISAFAAYSLEKRLAKDPSRFGKGAIEGIAGPESANNAAAQTHFIPMLVLGIPPGPTLAVLLGAMTMVGIDPGPQVITSHPDLFWGMIASMWIGNFFLVILNLPLIGIWVQDPEGPLPHPLSDHPAAREHRRLQPEQQHVCHPARRRLRVARLRIPADRMRSGAADAGAHPRADDGADAAARDALVARRSHRLPDQ